MENHEAFYIRTPINSQAVPFVFSIPHSGCQYSKKFLRQSAVPIEILRAQEDFCVDQIFSTAPHYGAQIMVASFPRSFVDLNREPYELDPEMFKTVLPPYVKIKSPYIANGIGTIARRCSNGDEIYADKLSWNEVQERIENFYFPYHNRLKKLLEDTRKIFAVVVLIDCHSMSGADTKTDIVVGNRFGQSASNILSDYICETLGAYGYDVARNHPYAGGFITQHYGSPSNNCHAIQIEINRSLYMNEKTLTLTQGWEKVSKNMRGLVEKLTQFDFGSIENNLS